MRLHWLLILPMALTTTGCWLGNPYEEFLFCYEPAAGQGVQEGNRAVYHATATIRSISQNDPAEPAVGDCGADDSYKELPEWIIKMRDEAGNTTRFGWTFPEREIPNIFSGDVITMHVVQRLDMDAIGFVMYAEQCDDPTADECTIWVAADQGVGERNIEDSLIPPFELSRGEKVAQRNGDCGKVEYHQLEIRGGGETIALNPGTFDVLKAEEGGGQVDYWATNVDNHIWAIDVCEGAAEKFSFVLMRD